MVRYTDVDSIMLAGTTFSYLTTLNPEQVRRKDGRAVAHFKPATIQTELSGLLEMYKNWKVMTIFPIAMGKPTQASPSCFPRAHDVYRRRGHSGSLLVVVVPLVQPSNSMYAQRRVLVHSNPQHLGAQMDPGAPIPPKDPISDRRKFVYPTHWPHSRSKQATCLLGITFAAWVAEYIFLIRLDVQRGDLPPATDWTSPSQEFAPHFVSLTGPVIRLRWR